MDRRIALTLAGTVAVVLTAGSAAVAANLGILGSAPDEPVGRLDAQTVADLGTTTTVAPVVVTVDEIVPVEVPADTTAGAAVDDHRDDDHSSDDGPDDDSSGPRGAVTSPIPTPTTSAPTARVDDHGGQTSDDHEHEDDDHGDRSGHDADDDD